MGNNGAPYAYNVNFSIGFTLNLYKDPHNLRLYVRAVRSVPAAGVGAELAGDPGQGAGIAGNGDVNGDLSLDLSDAIYLLSFLFLGGPPPPPLSPAEAAKCAEINRPPEIEPIGTILAREGAEISFEVGASDPDHDTISYSIEAGPDGTSMTRTSVPSKAQELSRRSRRVISAAPIGPLDIGPGTT